MAGGCQGNCNIMSRVRCTGVGRALFLPRRLGQGEGPLHASCRRQFEAGPNPPEALFLHRRRGRGVGFLPPKQGLSHQTTRSAHLWWRFSWRPTPRRYFRGVVAEGCQENFDMINAQSGVGTGLPAPRPEAAAAAVPPPPQCRACAEPLSAPTAHSGASQLQPAHTRFPR